MGWKRVQTNHKRKPYSGTKAVDSHCRNHGSCPWCEGNRLHEDAKLHEKAEYDFNVDIDEQIKIGVR